MNGHTLSLLYQRAHDRMRDLEGLLPQEAFDELMKFLFYKDCSETSEDPHGQSSHTDSTATPAEIRGTFKAELERRAPWALRLWPGCKFHLSDRTLSDLQRLFADVQLTKLPLDLRSTALSTFLTSDVRRSLGIFPTPVEVVRSMIEIVAPSQNDVVMDPACGTGTFLIEAARFISAHHPSARPITVYGIDKNPRMLLLADFNLGHTPNLVFQRACLDSLKQLRQPNETLLGLGPNSVDVILTNPPFGVTVTQHDTNLSLFDTETVSLSRERNRVSSEVLFVQLCLDLLRPGGRLGIVLPRSVITNERISEQRHAIDRAGYLTDLIDLPPETFVSTGTQTTTVAAFFRKHTVEDIRKSKTVRVCHVTNVGFDTTGRHRNGNELPLIASKLAKSDLSGQPTVTTHTDVAPTATLQRAAHFLFSRNGLRVGKALREFVESAYTGRTPGRSAYTDHGVFILKVGNLTGRGIDWAPRDRNFVSFVEGARRLSNPDLSLRKGDVVLTSSAHAARYIAKKVDLVAHIPEEYDTVTFVGEVIRLRAASGVDPFVLLAALRHPHVRSDLQACVRGQTAHLNPCDLMEVKIPYDLRVPDHHLTKVAAMLRREADLAFELCGVAARSAQLLKSAAPTPI